MLGEGVDIAQGQGAFDQHMDRDHALAIRNMPDRQAVDFLNRLIALLGCVDLRQGDVGNPVRGLPENALHIILKKFRVWRVNANANSVELVRVGGDGCPDQIGLLSLGPREGSVFTVGRHVKGGPRVRCRRLLQCKCFRDAGLGAAVMVDRWQGAIISPAIQQDVVRVRDRGLGAQWSAVVLGMLSSEGEPRLHALLRVRPGSG